MYRILLIDTKRSNPNHYICTAICQALQCHGQVERVVKADWGTALQEALRHECNLLFAFDGEELHQEIMARLAAVCGRSLLWVTEDPYELSINVRNAAFFDLIFTNDSASVHHYGAKGRHLPLAASRDIHYLEICEEEYCLYDLFFAGTAWPNRVVFFNEAFRHGLDRFKLKLALPTNPHLPPPRLDLPRSAWNWRTSNAGFARFANRSRVTLMLPRVFSASGNKAYAETPGPRLFETALAGGVQLAHESLLEINQYFAEGSEYLSFVDYPDLIDKIGFLRNHPEQRRRMALAAQKKAMTLHTYEHRVEELLVCVKQLPVPALRMGINEEKPTLLMVTHNMSSRGHFGGVEIYQDLLAHAFQGRYRVLFFLQSASCFHKYEVLDASGTLLETIALARPVRPTDLQHDELERAFYMVLTRYGVDLIHFQHCINHTPSLIYIARALGVPTVLTLHDYYPICHEFNLIAHHGAYCDPAQITQSQCDVCLWQKHGMPPGSQAQRRSFWAGALGAVDVVLSNTQGVLELFGRIYPSVAHHPLRYIVPVPVAEVIQPKNDGEPTLVSLPLKVAVFGNFSTAKGGDLLLRCLSYLANHPVEFHLVGRVDLDYYQSLQDMACERLVVHGAYSSVNLADIIGHCHVSLHVSIWPETYCLTLAEAWRLHLVPIVTDIGALGERVIDGENGFVIPCRNEGALIDLLLWLVDDPSRLERVRARIVQGQHGLYATRDEHVAALADIYWELQQRRSAHGFCAKSAEDDPFSVAQLGVFRESNSWVATRRQFSPLRPQVEQGVLLSRFSPMTRAYRYYRQQGFAFVARKILRYLFRRLQ